MPKARDSKGVNKHRVIGKKSDNMRAGDKSKSNNKQSADDVRANGEKNDSGKDIQGLMHADDALGNQELSGEIGKSGGLGLRESLKRDVTKQVGLNI